METVLAEFHSPLNILRLFSAPSHPKHLWYPKSMFFKEMFGSQKGLYLMHCDWDRTLESHCNIEIVVEERYNERKKEKRKETGWMDGQTNRQAGR